MAEIEVRSQELLDDLTKGLDFSIPDVDFNDDSLQIPQELIDALKNVPEPLTEGQLTSRKVGGSGMFDAIMDACKDHLRMEFEEGRITGADYTTAYISMMNGALQFAVQYLLGKDQSYYGALGAQIQGITASIQANTAKVQLAIAKAQAHQNKAQYALSVLNLGATDKQVLLVEAQTETQKQQKELLVEQTEQAHAQVSDTQLDGVTPVTGYTGNQNKLLQQQVVSFKKDAIIKSAKIYSDSLTTQLSMNTATVAGTGLDSQSIGTAMGKLANSMDNL